MCRAGEGAAAREAAWPAAAGGLGSRASSGDTDAPEEMMREERERDLAGRLCFQKYSESEG